jgi:hypothetical protein
MVLPQGNYSKKKKNYEYRRSLYKTIAKVYEEPSPNNTKISLHVIETSLYNSVASIFTARLTLSFKNFTHIE